jgi:hypothetical protein
MIWLLDLNTYRVLLQGFALSDDRWYIRTEIFLFATSIHASSTVDPASIAPLADDDDHAWMPLFV